MPFEPRIFPSGQGFPGPHSDDRLSAGSSPDGASDASSDAVDASPASDSKVPTIPAPWNCLGTELPSISGRTAVGRVAAEGGGESLSEALADELPGDLALLAEQLSTDAAWISQAYPARRTIVPSLVNDALVAAAIGRHPYRVAMARAWSSVQRTTVTAARVAAAGVPWRRAAHYAWSRRPTGYRGWHGLAACCMVAAAIALAMLPTWNGPVEQVEGPLSSSTLHDPVTGGPATYNTPRAGTFAPASPLPNFASQLGTSGMGVRSIPASVTPPRPTPPLTPEKRAIPANHRAPHRGLVPIFLFQDLTPSEQEGVLDLLDDSKMSEVSVEI